MPQRILHITPALDRAGAEKQMALLARGLPRPEFDLQVCALSHDGPLAAELTEAGVPVSVIGRRWSLDPQAWWRLRRQIARLRPQLVHTWGFAASAYGGSAARACGVERVVVAQRSIAPRKTSAEMAIDDYITRRADAVVANAAAVRDFWVGRGVATERIRVIPPGVPIAPAPAISRPQFLKELGLPEHSRLVGLVGRLRREKRVKDAIWAADLLKVIRDDVHLLIVGDGPQSERLLRYRDQVEIGDKVHFLGARGDLRSWMPHLDVLWSTSVGEGQSSAVLEAMAAGVPVVASNVPGTRDLVVHEVNGYLVELGHRAGFTRWSNHLLDHPDLTRQLGEAGRQRVMKDFSVEAMVEGHVALYRQLLT